jgi:putative peptidoglycan lipid II flippase
LTARVGPAGAGGRLAAAAMTIALLTVVARLAGFARTLVFAGVVGSTDLGDAYQTANTIPNIIFEVVAGGALSVIVVPLLAGPIAAADTGRVHDLSSALLTWTLLLLVPLAAVVALLAGPIVGLLTGGAGVADAPTLRVGTDMLRVFAVQLPLYGLGVVLTGVLFAHHRFVWPVIAPLLSSVTVIAVYLVFAVVEGPGTTVAAVSPAGELILSVGTTLGVAVLTLCLLIPVRSLGLRPRPVLTVGAGERRQAAGLASAAVLIVLAQQVATAWLIRLANGGATGSVVLFGLAQTVFLLPWAVLAVPLSTPTFPVLARAAAEGDHDTFDRTFARTGRGVVLAAGLGAGLLVGTAVPVGRVLSAVTKGHPSPALLAAAVVAYAPALLGFSLFALVNRALSALGQARYAAYAALAGWATTVVAALALSALLPARDRIVALTLANSVGMSVLTAVAFGVVRRRRGGAALAGMPRTLLGSLAAAPGSGVAGWLAGWAVVRLAPGVGMAVVAGMLAAGVATGVFLAVAYAVDRDDVRPVVAAVLRRLRSGHRIGETGRDEEVAA